METGKENGLSDNSWLGLFGALIESSRKPKTRCVRQSLNLGDLTGASLGDYIVNAPEEPDSKPVCELMLDSETSPSYHGAFRQPCDCAPFWPLPLPSPILQLG